MTNVVEGTSGILLCPICTASHNPTADAVDTVEAFRTTVTPPVTRTNICCRIAKEIVGYAAALVIAALQMTRAARNH